MGTNFHSTTAQDGHFDSFFQSAFTMFQVCVCVFFVSIFLRRSYTLLRANYNLRYENKCFLSGTVT